MSSKTPVVRLAEYFGVEESFLIEVLKEIKIEVHPEGEMQSAVVKAKLEAQGIWSKIAKKAAGDLHRVGKLLMSVVEPQSAPTQTPQVQMRNPYTWNNIVSPYAGGSLAAVTPPEEQKTQEPGEIEEIRSRIPTTYDLIEPTFLCYADRGNAPTYYRDLAKMLEYRLNLDPRHRTVLCRRGDRTLLESNISWTVTYLRKALLITKTSPGYAKITDIGKQVHADWKTHKQPVDLKYLRGLPGFKEFYTRKETKRSIAEDTGSGSDELPKHYVIGGVAVSRETLLEAAAMWSRKVPSVQIVKHIGCTRQQLYAFAMNHRYLFPRHHKARAAKKGDES